MKVKYRNIQLFFAAFIIDVLVMFSYIKYSGYSGDITAGIINCAIVSLTLVIVLDAMRKKYEKGIHSGAEFLLFVAAIYNYNTSTKFTVDSLFDGFISNPVQRIMGIIFINTIIIATAIIWKKAKTDRTVVLNIEELQQFKISKFAVYSLTAIYTIVQLMSLRSFGMPLYNYSLTISAALSAIVMCITYIIYTTVFLYTNNGDSKWKLRYYIPIIIILSMNFYLSLLSGKKNFFMQFAFIIGCDFIASNKLKYRTIEIAAIMSAPVLQVFTSLSEIVSGRMAGINAIKLARYHAFRYDLSDFAITIASRYGNSSNILDMLKAAFIESLPSGLFPGINKVGEEAYLKNMNSIGLGVTDYNDTLFSMGAQVMGYLGIVIWFVIVVVLFEWMTKKIVKIKRVGTPLFFLSMNYFIIIESGWFSFFSATRDLLITLCIGYVVMIFIINRRKRMQHGFSWVK